MRQIRHLFLVFGLLTLSAPIADAHHSPYFGIQTRWGGRGEAPDQFDFMQLQAVAAASDGSVYTLQADTVKHFSRDGVVLSEWQAVDETPDEYSPQDIAVGASGSVYVIRIRPDRVLKFSPAGELLATWNGAGGSAAFDDPLSLATDDSGRVYVSDRAGGLVLNEDGAVIRRLSATVFSFDVDAGGYVYAIAGLAVVLRHTPGGEFDGYVAPRRTGSGPGEFSEEGGPEELSLSDDATIWLTDRANGRIQQFSSEGKLLAVCGEPGRKPLTAPWDVATSGDEVFVIDAAASRVFRLGAVRPPAQACDALSPKFSDLELVRKGSASERLGRSALRLSSSEAAHATVVLRRRFRPPAGHRHRWKTVASGRANVRRGANRVQLGDAFGSVPGGSGKYRLRVHLIDEAGNRSPLRRVSFKAS